MSRKTSLTMGLESASPETLGGSEVTEMTTYTRDRRDNLVALINTYNEASSPYVARTDAEHAIERQRAKIALASIRRNYEPGVDYRELSNGALWPAREA